MKKAFAKIIALIVTATLCLTFFAACNWITTNTDRDMAQVVAAVKISDDVDSEDIYKRELNSGFLSYGYQYMSYGYTSAQVYQLILDNLVTNKIIVQQARVELAKLYNELLTREGTSDFEKYYKANALANGTQINPKSGDIESLKKYLTQYEYDSAYYAVHSAADEMITAYVDEDEEEEEREDVTYTPRTVPTVEEDEDLTEEDLKSKKPDDDDYDIANVVLKNEGDSWKDNYTNVYDLNNAVYKAFKIDVSTNERKKAYSSLIKFLKDNGLIKSNEAPLAVAAGTEVDNNAFKYNILDYSYFQDLLKNQLANAIVSKYEDSLITTVEADLTDDKVWNSYCLEYERQKATFGASVSAYEQALDAVSDTSFVLYNPVTAAGSYGYVANLLIGFSETQSTLLSEKISEAGLTEAQIADIRNEFLREVYAFDQRSSWVNLSYGDYDKTSKSFKFGKDYRVSDITSIANFIGTVKPVDEDGITDEDDNGVKKTTWSFSEVTPAVLPFSDFYSTYVKAELGMNEIYFDEANPSMSVDALSTYNEDTFDIINDLIYTFSTDGGSLGKYYGYLYSPISTTYVSEFEAAAKACVEKGEGAYTIVATQYGYHIMICTKVVNGDPYTIDAAGKTAFIADFANEDSIAYKYRKVQRDSLVTSGVSAIANRFVNNYRENNVTYYQARYSDLIPTSNSSSAS